MRISSVQREGLRPQVLACASREEHEAALHDVVSRMARAEGFAASEGVEDAGPRGLTAVIAPYAQAAKKLAAQLADLDAVLLDDAGTLPSEGLVVLPLKLAKGLEFDRVVIPDASERVFPTGDDVARRRLYTSISRATHELAVLSNGPLTSWLAE